MEPPFNPLQLNSIDEILQLINEALAAHRVTDDCLPASQNLARALRQQVRPALQALAAVALPRWVPVAERLPRPGYYVLLHLDAEQPPVVGYYNLTQHRFFAAANPQGLALEVFPLLWQEINLPATNTGKEPSNG